VNKYVSLEVITAMWFRTTFFWDMYDTPHRIISSQHWKESNNFVVEGPKTNCSVRWNYTHKKRVPT